MSWDNDGGVGGDGDQELGDEASSVEAEGASEGLVADESWPETAKRPKFDSDESDFVVEIPKKEFVAVVLDEAEQAELDAKKAGYPWYVVHTYSGYEQRAKLSLEERVKTAGASDKFAMVVVPHEKVVELVRGEKKTSSKKVFPGYILVRMILDNDSWIVVRTTQGITGFVGAGTKPTAISDQEVAAIMKFVKQEQPKFKAKFSQGEAVKVTDGPFSDFVGTISAMDEDKGKVTVLVSIFGRETPVELDFLQVNKL